MSHHFFIAIAIGEIWSLPLLFEPEKDKPVLEVIVLCEVLTNGFDWTSPLISPKR